MAGIDPHQKAEIEPGHVDQVAFLDVLPAPEPNPTHPAGAVQGLLETAFYEFRPQSFKRLANPGR